MKFWHCGFFALTALCSCEAQQISGTIDKIAFGSCSRENDKEQMWSEIAGEHADLFILCGDNVYGDTDDMSVLKEKYNTQKTNPDYQNLLNKTPIIGIWDDHDYGINDGGKYYFKKDESKSVMLDFFDVPKDNPVWRHTGAYNSYTYGSGDQKIKILLLDVRYFRDTLMADTVTSARYLVNEQGDILGDQQWLWLEKELTNSDAAIHILVSGIQVIAEEHGFEKWANFPVSRNRLFSLLEKTQPKRTFIISGDRHIAELSRMELNNLPYPLYDFTASGLTHTWAEPWQEENKHRVDDLIIKKNYGTIDINWNNKTPEITFKVKGHGDSTFLQHSFHFPE